LQKQKPIWHKHIEEYVQTFLEPLKNQCQLLRSARATLERFRRTRNTFNDVYRNFNNLKTTFLTTHDAMTIHSAVAASRAKDELMMTKNTELGDNATVNGDSTSKRDEARLEKAEREWLRAKRVYEEFAESLVTEIDNFKTQRSLEMRQLFYQFAALKVI